MTNPQIISIGEWKMLMGVPTVMEIWDIAEGETAESFSSRVYGAKFAYPEVPTRAPACFYLLCGGYPYDRKVVVHHSGTDFLAVEDLGS